MKPLLHRSTRPAADLTPVSRGLPVDWEILRAGLVLSVVACPDEATAKILATFRYGTDVTVRRQGVAT